MDMSELARRAFKYLVEGLAVLQPPTTSKKMNVEEIVMVGVTAATLPLLFSTFLPQRQYDCRQGAGFGIGASLVGGPALPGVPPLA